MKVHNVVLAFSINASPNPFGYSSPNLGHLLMWVCGPRTGKGCKPGARLTSPCIHVLTALYILGVLAFDPNADQPLLHDTHIIDAGGPGGLPTQYSRDVLRREAYFNLQLLFLEICFLTVNTVGAASLCY